MNHAMSSGFIFVRNADAIMARCDKSHNNLQEKNEKHKK
jgi:hypothetical protein